MNEVQKHKRWLVEAGDTIGEQAKDNDQWKSQILAMAEAARRETEPRVLLNLLRYQAARNPNWYKENNVVDPLYKKIERCISEAGEDTTVAIALIRHLLIYTYRSFTYHAPKPDKKAAKAKGARS